MEEAQSFMDVRCPPRHEMKTHLKHVTNALASHTDILHSHKV